MTEVALATTSTANHYLVADARERAVVPFLESALAGRLVAGRQVNTGDYLICRRSATSEICACVERKTLADFAASFKDGRHANVEKMRRLRASTGCQLYFIIEGPAFPSPARRFARIPYASILSAITNLMVRDSIMIIQTENEAHTAKRLADLVNSFDKCKRAPPMQPDAPPMQPDAPPMQPDAPPMQPDAPPMQPDALPMQPDALPMQPDAPPMQPDAPPMQPDAPPMQPDAPPMLPAMQIPESVTGAIYQSDDEAVVKLWATLRGVSVVLGKIISCKFSVADLVAGRVSPAALAALRTANGRQINPAARASLTAVARGAEPVAIRLVSGVRGFSPDAATLILKEVGGIVNLCAEGGAEKAAATLLPRGTGTARLGDARAGRLLRMLTYSALQEQAALQEHAALQKK